MKLSITNQNEWSTCTNQPIEQNNQSIDQIGTTSKKQVYNLYYRIIRKDVPSWAVPHEVYCIFTFFKYQSTFSSNQWLHWNVQKNSYTVNPILLIRTITSKILNNRYEKQWRFCLVYKYCRVLCTKESGILPIYHFTQVHWAVPPSIKILLIPGVHLSVKYGMFFRRNVRYNSQTGIYRIF